MPTLTIRFEDMFLYVSQAKGPDLVLLPSGAGGRKHNVTIKGLGIDRKLSGVEVSFVNGKSSQAPRLAETAQRSAPREPRLVSLPDVLGQGTVVRKEFLTGAIGPALNARIVLPNGATTAFEAKRRKARSVKWDFKTDPNSKPVLAGVELTDIMQTTVQLSAHDQPTVRIDGPGNSQTFDDLDKDGNGNYVVTIHNADEGCSNVDDLPEQEYTLHDYNLLYALTNAVGSKFPVPTGTYGTPKGVTITSLCLPICGGADCPGEP